MSLYLGNTKIDDVRIAVESPNGYIDTSDATLYRNDQLPAGITAYARRAKYTGTATVDPTVTLEDDTITAPAGFYTQAQTLSIDADDLTVTQNGTYTPEGDYYSSVVVNVTSEGYETQTKTVTPTTSTQSVTPDVGYDGLSSVTVNPIPSNYIVPSGTISITENGTGIDVSSYASADVSVPTSASPSLQTKTVTYTPGESQQTDTITADSGYDGLEEMNITVYAVSSTYVGTGIIRKSSSDLTVSGATVTAPAGYYSADASTSVAAGSAGTPTASKGAVSNHSVEVTPSVTNTTGYITGGTQTGTPVSVSAGELVSGTLSISANGTEDVTNYAAVSVDVQPTLQAKTATPTESQQTIAPDSGYDGLSSVTVEAVSDTYVGSGIDTRSGSDLTVSGATVTAPAGYYASVASKSVASGSAATPATTITVNPTISVDAAGLITATTSASQNVTPTVNVGYISSGTAGTITVGGTNTQQLTTQAAATITPTESEQNAVAAGVYTTGIVKVGAISSSYVGSGVTQRDDTDLAVSGATVTVPAGYYADQETASVAAGTAGTPTATKGTVSNNSVTITPSVINTTGYITGSTINGTAVTISASELVSGTLTVDSSGTKDVTNYASASVPTGTEGTPTATKGTVSNNSVTVTPSVTNTSGFISGGTHTGTAVTVLASELVSGSETKTTNGTYDVTNLASVVVNVPIVTYYTGSSAPSSSLGSDGDIYLQTS